MREHGYRNEWRLTVALKVSNFEIYKKLFLIALYLHDCIHMFRKELKHFSTQTKKVNDPAKKNVIIMGRKTYFGVPETKRPLPERFNVVLTSEPDKYEFPADVLVVKSMDEAFAKIREPELEKHIENVWIVGGKNLLRLILNEPFLFQLLKTFIITGHSVYKEAMESPNCHRIYFTKVMATFDCDAFFPALPDNFKLVPNDEDIPSEIQEENGIKYQYQIYEKV